MPLLKAQLSYEKKAIIEAHPNGVLTGASLMMVTGEAFEQAVDLARQRS